MTTKRPFQWIEKELNSGFSGIESILNDVFQGIHQKEQEESISLPIDLLEDNNEFVIEIEIPGIDKKDISLTYHKGNIEVSGEKKRIDSDKKLNQSYRERSFSTFLRKVHIGENITWEDTKATYDNGVLTITVPKKTKENQSVKIEIQ